MDVLKLNGIDVECILGDLPEERVKELEAAMEEHGSDYQKLMELTAPRQEEPAAGEMKLE